MALHSGQVRAEIPLFLWVDAQHGLEKRLDAAGKTNSKKKSQGVHLLQFTFSLRDRTFVKWNVEEKSNLFFEYATAIAEDVSREYIVVQMDDEDLVGAQNDGNKSKVSFSYDVDPLREAILRSGIAVAQEQGSAVETDPNTVFHLIGCSNSQVQRHCYIFRRASSLQQNEARIEQVLPNLQMLERNSGIPKRVKYSGLLFSGITSVQIPKDTVVEEIATTERNGFDFTDGPGLISLKLAKLITAQLGNKKAKGCPSIFQIRYCGTVTTLNKEKTGFVCKGVLVVDPTNEDTYTIQVRKSMLKTNASPTACKSLQCILGICDYSQPSPGRLGQQLVCLLSHIVEKKDFLDLQAQHLKCLSNALQDPFSMAWILVLDRRPHVWQEFHKLLLDELDRPSNQQRDQKVIPRLYKKCASAVIRHMGGLKKPKVQLPLAASRTLFGAVFPELLHDDLQEGECVVLLEDGPLIHNHSPGEETLVLVSRSPTYYPGDIRVLRVVALPDDHPGNTLRNCILFSTKGKRPDVDKMGGGDLDGDRYLVMWHPILLKYVNALRGIQPASYDGIGPKNVPSSLESDWVHYVAQTDNEMLGEVENVFYKLAKQYGIDSASINQLNTLFGSLVDRHPTSLREFSKLKGSVVGTVSSREFLWEAMARMQKESIANTGFPHDTSDDTLLLPFYNSFEKKAADSASNTSILAAKFVKEFDYHFLESLQGRAIPNWVREFSRRVADRAVPLTNVYRPQNGTDELPERLEMSTKESRAFSAFDKRAYSLYATPIAELDAIMRPYVQEIKKHESLRNTIRDKRDKMIRELECRRNDLESRHDGECSQHAEWERAHFTQWETEKSEKRRELDRRLAEPRRRLKHLQEELRAMKASLGHVNSELGAMWYYLGVFSRDKVAANERKQYLEEGIGIQDNVIESLQITIAEEERCEMYKLKTMQNVEYAQTTRRYKRTVDFLVLEMQMVDDTIDKCGVEFKDAMTATKRKSVLALVVKKEEELTRLRQGVAASQQPAIQSRARIDAIQNELRALKVELETMFCPDILARARVSIEKSDEKMRSMELGRGHILHSVEQSRRKWDERLKTGIGSVAEIRREWQALENMLKRVISLEENRLLGFPDSKGKRKVPLLIYHKRSVLRDILRESQALVLTAGTGCGKSTQIPQYIADDFYSYRAPSEDSATCSFEKPVRICCTQPRRVAAQGLASRVAKEYQTKLGELVGFKVGSRGRTREDCVKISEQTVIEFVTEGLLLHSLARSSEFLRRYDCIIVDEMHERNAEQDLCLSLLRDYLKTCSRPLFKVIVMSASIDARRFCEYFHGCPTLDCPGKNYPIEETYMGDGPLAEGKLDHASDYAVDVLFTNIVKKGEREPDGDVLIFLTGASEIDDCVTKINSRATTKSLPVVAYPLYSQLDETSITAATDYTHRHALSTTKMAATKGKAGKKVKIRKVICATNIAETSLTVDGVRYVIESGLAKKARYDHSLRCSVLGVDWVSYASTIQRKGRAGRTSPGSCFYLYSERHHHDVMVKYDKPKILEMPVDELILLSLSVCGRSVEDMGLLDAPEAEDIACAKERLTDLGLIEHRRGKDCVTLTEDGYVACTLKSQRPESIRMILHACENFPQLVEPAMKLAAILSSTESVFCEGAEVHEEDRLSHVYGDHLLALQHMEWFENAISKSAEKKGKLRYLKNKCRERGLDFGVLKALQQDVELCHTEMKKQKLLPSAKESDQTSMCASSQDTTLLRIAISGYFHQIVECIDADYMRTIGCSHLTIPAASIFLDRRSFLNSSIASGYEVKSRFILDDETSTDDTADELSELLVTNEEVNPYLLLHGRLQKVSKLKRIFMLDASVIEGSWVSDEAPERWLRKVAFRSRNENLCGVTVKSIGPVILKECCQDGKFIARMKEKSNVTAICVSYEGCCVRICGNQTSVNAAKAELERCILLKIRQRCQRDQAHNFLMKLRLGSGMTVTGRKDQRPLNEALRAFGTDDLETTVCNNMVVITIDKKKSEISAFPIRGCSLDSVKRSFKEISEAKFTLERRFTGFIVKVQLCDAQYAPRSDWYEASKKILHTLKQHKAFCCVTVSIGSFANERALTVAGMIGVEASNNSLFWKTFRSKLTSGDKEKDTVNFVPSQRCFSFGPSSEQTNQLALSFKRSVHKLSKEVKFADSVLQRGFERYEVRRFASILAEVKKCRPNTLLYIAEVGLSGGESVEPDFAMSDYAWLTQLMKTSKIISIRIGFTTLGRNQATKRVQDFVHAKFSIQTMQMRPPETDTREEAPKGCSWKYCVMCRRDVLVRFWKGAKSETLTNALQGWNLTLCGCSYCRECFRHGITESLRDETVGLAKCLQCKRQILSSNCFEIIGRKNDPNQKVNYAEEEWNHMCRLAEANFCRANQTYITTGTREGRNNRSRGCATCPDCGVSMVFPGGYLFFVCRNPACRSRMCTRCCRVVTATTDTEKCIDGLCEVSEE